MYTICFALTEGEGNVRLKQVGLCGTGTLMCCPEVVCCADDRATKCTHIDV